MRIRVPDISVVVVTYNSAGLIRGCLEELRSSSRISEVIIWDNSSQDGTVRAVRELDESGFPFNVILIENDANVGFAKAVNGAASMANGDYVLLLNPDCVIAGTGVDGLCHELGASPDIGAIAPEIVHPTGRLRVKSAGFEPTAVHMLSQAFGLPQIHASAKGFNLYSVGETGSSTNVDWVSGACLLIETSRFRKLGGLSERWFMYAEDIDLCRRIREIDLRVVHFGGVRSTHLVGASSDVGSGPAWTLWLENLYEYYVLNLNRGFFDRQLWKGSAFLTFSSRSFAYWINSIRLGGDKDWLRESGKFADYARASLRLR